MEGYAMKPINVINRGNCYVAVGLAIALTLAAPLARAFTPDNTPLYLSGAAKPRMMFVMSRDETLTRKAYTDYSDIDNDNKIDITYVDTYDYYGYFDPRKCYSYNTTDNRFVPDSLATGTNYHTCNDASSSLWSGNLLNWASMTRLDIVRKVLYGGLRSTDVAAGDTVLERAYIPTDAHAFVKVYNPGNDTTLRQFVPSSATNGSGAISLCNVSNSTSSTPSGSLSVTPLIRVAYGSWPGWSSTEVRECAYRDEYNGGLNTQPQYSNAPATHDLTARVQVCIGTPADTSLNESNCVSYPNVSGGTSTPRYKPDGLLQKYGKQFKFGLITGSWFHNFSGGVLRRTLDEIMNSATPANNEVNSNTGVLIARPLSATTNSGLIGSLNLIRPARFNSNGHSWTDCSTYGILPGSVYDYPPQGAGSYGCTDWGNPIAEMYAEALRYFAGKAGATDIFSSGTADSPTYIPNLTRATWDDPIPDDEYCAKCSIVVVSAGQPTFDTDQAAADGVVGIDSNGSDTELTATNVNTWTNSVGSGESINGNSYLIGDNGSTNNGLCTAKTLTGLADAKGTCPELPNKEGGYKIAGLMYFSHTRDIRNGAWNTPSEKRPLTLDNYAVSLADSVPTFDIPVGSTNVVHFVPLCRANNTATATIASSGWRNCTMQDARIEEIHYDADGNITYGKMLVVWEDSLWGNDYDLDGVERIAFCVGASCENFPNAGDAAIATDAVKIVTSVPLAAAGNALAFGYTLTGTTNDGAKVLVLRPGNQNYNHLYTPYTGTGTEPSPNTSTWTSGTSTAGVLKDPLWYAAKWGGFTGNLWGGSGGPEDPVRTAPFGAPHVANNWDQMDNTTGIPDSDEMPDHYFQVRNPAGLEKSLDLAMTSALEGSATAAAVAVNTASLMSGSYVFQVNFTSNVWSGHIVARAIDSNGVVDSTSIETCGSSPSASCPWEAGRKLENQATRHIITWNPDVAGAQKGVAFEWANIGATNQALLNASDSDGSLRLDYLRGSSAREGATGTPSFRVRSENNLHFKLGDIVDSAPIYVGQPPFLYPDSSYLAFRNNPKDPTDSTTYARDPIIYTGANDGMLHGFYACTDTAVTKCGTEAIAYVPSAVYTNLAALTDRSYAQNHKYFVDGSPTVGDVEYGSWPSGTCATGTSCWRSVLVSGLGAGGKSYFALDVTDPADFNQSNASKLALWEFTDTDLGYAYSQPTIAKLQNGTWAVFFGNGYGSTNGYAVLYVVNAATGSLITSITLDNSGTNGLSTPAVVDVDGDYKMDYVYAGDLRGNLWKVDIRDTNPGSWTSMKLFQAMDTTPTSPAPDIPQPITTRPEVGVHPTGLGGYMIYFGTGKYLETGDNVPSFSPVHSFYGIWDNEDGTTVSHTKADDDLQQQTITEATSGSLTYRTMSNNAVAWDDGGGTNTKRGWYINLLTADENPPSSGEYPNKGEMVAYSASLREGRVIFETLVPQDFPCVKGGFSWLMEVSATNGGPLPFDVFDINGDGVFDSNDRVGGSVVSGLKTSTGITPEVTFLDDPAKKREIKLATGTSGTVQSIANNPGPNAGFGRNSWRQLR